MATRPTIAVTVRASATNYSTGDPALIPSVTKIARAGPDMIEGYKVDTLISPQAVSAQNKNYEDNVVDQWAEWVSLGSSANGGNTHIVETDSGGDISIQRANCRDVRVAPNTGSDGIEVTTSGGSKGLEVLQDATCTDHGVNVTAVLGAAAPAFFSSTVSSVGMLISHGSIDGLVLGSTANGGIVGPSIRMSSNTIEPINNSVGTLWNREQNSIENLKTGMGSSAGYIIIAKNAPCYARSALVAGFALLGSQTDQVIASSFTWKTDQVPQDNDQVRVTIWGKIGLNSDEVNTVELKVRDTTAVAEICTLTIANPDNGSGVFEQQSATFSAIYTLPAAGARNFDLVWDGVVNGGFSGNFTGYVEIEQLRG